MKPRRAIAPMSAEDASIWTRVQFRTGHHRMASALWTLSLTGDSRDAYLMYDLADCRRVVGPSTKRQLFVDQLARLQAPRMRPRIYWFTIGGDAEV